MTHHLKLWHFMLEHEWSKLEVLRIVLGRDLSEFEVLESSLNTKCQNLKFSASLLDTISEPLLGTNHIVQAQVQGPFVGGVRKPHEQVAFTGEGAVDQ